MSPLACPLCSSDQLDVIAGLGLDSHYLVCAVCDLRFLDSAHYLSSEDEKARYLTHNNDVTDPRYRAFVKPLFDAIRARLVSPGPAGSKTRGLDYGAGTGPVLAEMLEAEEFEITRYDPYFWPVQLSPENPYDFIFSCEVVEHFHSPGKEFARLRSLLKPDGFIAIMTHLYEPGCDFSTWYYRRDPTHVAFYSRLTFEWMTQKLGFSKVDFVSSRVVALSL